MLPLSPFLLAFTDVATCVVAPACVGSNVTTRPSHQPPHHVPRGDFQSLPINASVQVCPLSGSPSVCSGGARQTSAGTARPPLFALGRQGRQITGDEAGRLPNGYWRLCDPRLGQWNGHICRPSWNDVDVRNGDSVREAASAVGIEAGDEASRGPKSAEESLAPIHSGAPSAIDHAIASRLHATASQRKPSLNSARCPPTCRIPSKCSHRRKGTGPSP